MAEVPNIIGGWWHQHLVKTRGRDYIIAMYTARPELIKIIIAAGQNLEI